MVYAALLLCVQLWICLQICHRQPPACTGLMLGAMLEALACLQVLDLYNLVPKPYPALTGRVSNLSGVITAQGTQCVLPYSYNGSAYDICLTADNGQAGA